MKKFKIKIDGNEYEGKFDTNAVNSESMYVVFHHNGMIGVINPTGIDLEIIKRMLFSNKEKVNYEITDKVNNFVLEIGEEE